MHAVLAVFVQMKLMLAMENGGKGEFAYVVDLVLYGKLPQGLVCRQARRNSRQSWFGSRSLEQI